MALDIPGHAKPGGGRYIHSPADAFLLFRGSLSRLRRERVEVAFLTRERRLLGTAAFAEGTAAAASLPIAAILRRAVAQRAGGLILAHNHPSGDAMPSRGDIQATRRIADAARALDITLVDHVVIAGEDARSFRLMNLL